MKRLLSMILAAAMVASMMAPVAYADDTLPITEPTATVQEQPAEDTPAETVPVETPTQEATPAPTETPVEATPAPTAEPTATPEPTAEPTPEPTAEPTPEPMADPTAEPTSEPELAEEPVVQVTAAPAEQANASIASDQSNPETMLILYKAEGESYYYGKLPVKVGKSGVKEAADYATVNTTDGYAARAAVVPINSDFWVFIKTTSNMESITYTDTWRNDDGTYDSTTVPIVVSDTPATDADTPPYMISSNYAYNSFGANPDSIYANGDIVQYDTDYTVSLSPDDYEREYTLDYVTGIGGVEVVSQPDENGNIVIRFPSGIKYGTFDYKTGAFQQNGGLCTIAHDAKGAYHYSRQGLVYVPGLYTAYSYVTSADWAGLLSENGCQIKFTNGNNWSYYGEVESVRADLVVNNYSEKPEKDMSDIVAATYDKENDAVTVRLTQTPETIDSQVWTLYLYAKYTDGGICSAYTTVSKKDLNTQISNWSPSTLGTRAGAATTVDVNYYVGSGDSGSWTPIPNDSSWTWSCNYTRGGFSFDYSDTMEYIKPGFTADGKVCFTVLKDFTVSGSNNTIQFQAESNWSRFSISVDVGTPQIYLNTVSGGMTWPALIRDAGCDLIGVLIVRRLPAGQRWAARWIREKAPRQVWNT